MEIKADYADVVELASSPDSAAFINADIFSEEEDQMDDLNGETILLQAEVLAILSNRDDAVVMKLIDRISPEVRAIIRDFKKQKGRLPTADEIIWIIGEHHKLDPRYVDQLLEDTVGIEAIAAVKAALHEHKATCMSA